MTKLRRTANFVSLAAELSHVFCCGIPMLVAILSAGTQLGLGGGFLFLHDILHGYEVPIFVGSGLLLLVGFGLHYLSFFLDCRETGCVHSDCSPKKFKVGWIFSVALVLFAANLAFYLLSNHGG